MNVNKMQNHTKYGLLHVRHINTTVLYTHKHAQSQKGHPHTCHIS